MENRKITVNFIEDEGGLTFEERFYTGEGYNRTRVSREKVFITFEELERIIKQYNKIKQLTP